MKIENLEILDKPPIYARFDLALDNGMIIRRCKVMVKDGSKWISYPSEKYLKDGETKYYSYIFFADRAASDAMRDHILSLIESKPSIPVEEEEYPF